MENPKERTQKCLDCSDYQTILQRVLVEIREGRTTNLDPCIGDQGCHMRSLPLSIIAYKVLNGETLTVVEKDFLVSLGVVWENTIRTVTRNGFFLREKTGSDILPTVIKHNYTAKQRGHIMYAHRKLAANIAIIYFDQYLQNFKLLQPDLHESLQFSFKQDQRLLNREKEKIICLPYLTSGKIILQQIIESGRPFIVMIKRYSRTNGTIRLQEARPLFYTMNAGGKYRAVQGVVDIDIPCVTFEFYSFFDLDLSHESPLYQPDFEGFVGELVTIDIFDLIASNWVMHDQYADVLNKEIPPSYLVNNNSLRVEYDRLQRLAQANNLPPIVQVKVAETYEPENQVVEKNMLKLLNITPWFLLNHIYCSNFKNRRAYCDHLNLHRDEVLHPFIRIFEKTGYENALDFNPN